MDKCETFEDESGAECPGKVQMVRIRYDGRLGHHADIEAAPPSYPEGVAEHGLVYPAEPFAVIQNAVGR
jgi:hypothetical protein